MKLILNKKKRFRAKKWESEHNAQGIANSQYITVF